MKKQPENGKIETVRVTGVYLINKPISSFPNQTTITIGGENNSTSNEFHTALEKASRKTSQPVAKMK